jgi:hypothetical protein
MGTNDLMTSRVPVSRVRMLNRSPGATLITVGTCTANWIAPPITVPHASHTTSDDCAAASRSPPNSPTTTDTATTSTATWVTFIRAGAT